MSKKKGLGKGLSELGISTLMSYFDTNTANASSSSALKTLTTLPLTRIRPNPDQPRKIFDPAELERLSASIQAQGVLQPILVSPLPQSAQTDSAHYEIIAGERRWRAAKQAGLETIPALVQAFSQEQALIIALIENIQRENLNPIEEAVAFNKLMQESQLTHEALAEVLSKPRSSISNTLRLLSLESTVQALVANQTLSVGHAKILLGLTPVEQKRYAERVISEGLSVQKLREAVLSMGEKPMGEKQSLVAEERLPSLPPSEETFASWQQVLEQKLKAPIAFKALDEEKGYIMISYSNAKMLSKILKKML
eukprot:TRINITY_DN43026_c0_g1_i1.p1 TRINITY_DN43026_c0_g1~~TRINITY_DN43026_c0_g1_i1.p1  ORF type:complete len:310 (+),score=-30.77 TRINITY_DN43026_c0_g1_i1:858-1787(+)